MFTRVGVKNFSCYHLLYVCWQKIFRPYSSPSAIPRKIAGDHRLDFLLPFIFSSTWNQSFAVPGKIAGGHRLDFLLPSFLSSRKEKKVGVRGQSPLISPARRRVGRKNSYTYFSPLTVPEKIAGSH